MGTATQINRLPGPTEGVPPAEQAAPRAVVLYDGVCGFCNHMVQWLLRHDQTDRFRFAPQQSAFAEAALIRHGIDREALLASNSAYLLLDLSLPTERLLRRSNVGIAVLLGLGGGWRILGRLFQAVPRFMRDAVYSFVANNRFRISGRYEACPVPSATQRAKFLS